MINLTAYEINQYRKNVITPQKETFFDKKIFTLHLIIACIDTKKLKLIYKTNQTLIHKVPRDAEDDGEDPDPS